MKVEAQKNLLNVAISRCQGAISDRSLAQIGINAQGASLTVCATDRVLAIYASMDCEVMESGFCFVPGRLFSDVVKQLPEGRVLLEKQASFMILRAGQGLEFEMKIPLVEDLQWKNPPEFESQAQASIAATKLQYMIDQINFCVEQDSPRNYGTVGNLHRSEKGKLRLVGTDGFRLSYCDVGMELPENFLKSGICISKRGLAELKRMCQEGHETLQIAISDDESTMLATAPQYKIFARLSVVKYPNYRGVLPTANLHLLKIGRGQLQSMVRRVLLAADKSHALKMRFKEDSLTVSSKTVGSSESHESMEIRDYKGPEVEIAINGKFLTDVFSTMSGDELMVSFKSEDDPVVLLPRDEPLDCKSLHVLVPIRGGV